MYAMRMVGIDDVMTATTKRIGAFLDNNREQNLIGLEFDHRQEVQKLSLRDSSNHAKSSKL